MVLMDGTLNKGSHVSKRSGDLRSTVRFRNLRNCENATHRNFYPAAYASFQENVTGSFKVGKKFDAVIWDRDIMRLEPPTAVLEAKVLATIVDGKVIYGSLRS
jgi:hypothetical protein